MYPNSFMSFAIHMASLVACVLAMYSASVVESAIMGCHLLLQEMAPPPIMNINPMVDLLYSRSPAQSTSQYLTKPSGVNLWKHNLKCKVPCKQKMRLTTIQCSRLGIGHVLTHHTYWVCQIWPSTQHGIHQGSHCLLIKNLHHLVILVQHSSSILSWDQVALE
jgi:hypothetical protein